MIIFTELEVDSQWNELVNSFPSLFTFLNTHLLSASTFQCSSELGFRRAVDLEVAISRKGLPPFQILRVWVSLVQLIDESEEGIPLSRSLLSRGVYPSSYYRTFGRVFGQTWSDLRRMGLCRAQANVILVWNAYRFRADVK